MTLACFAVRAMAHHGAHQKCTMRWRGGSLPHDFIIRAAGSSGAPPAIASRNAIKLLVAELHALRLGERNKLIGGFACHYLGLLLFG